MERASRVSLAATVVVAWALGAVLLLPFCNVLFRCGCTWSWAGGTRHCNIHRRNVPHCPWCSYGDAAGVALYAVLGATQLGAAALAWRARRRWPLMLTAAMGGYVVMGALVALGWGWVAAYPWPYASVSPARPAVASCCAGE